MINVLRMHPLLTFFILTFILSWSLWIPMALDHYGLSPVHFNEGVVMISRLFGTLGPAAAAIIVSLLIGGRPAAKALLGQIKKWRVGWKWYVAAALVFPALAVFAVLLYGLLPGAQPFPFAEVTIGGIIAIMIILTISVLGEETGWRGFALPGLQLKWSPFVSSVILGTVWTLWHLPFWTILGELETFGFFYWLMSWAFITAGSIYITWFMNNTKNSLLMAFLFHFCYNMLVVGFMPVSSVIPAYAIMIAMAWGAALVVSSPAGKRWLGWKVKAPGL